MAGGLTLLTGTNASVPTPAAGKVTIFFSTDLSAPAYKDETGTVHSLTGAAGATGAAGPVGPTFLDHEMDFGEIGPPGPPGASGGGGGTSGILVGTLEISNTQFDNGNTTPLDIVAAPGANKVIIPVSAGFYCNVSVSKGANPTQRVRWNGDTGPVAEWVQGINLPLNNTGENWRYITCNFNTAASVPSPFSFANTTFDPRNKSLQWSQSANTAAGTGTGKVRISYFIADFS